MAFDSKGRSGSRRKDRDYDDEDRPRKKKGSSGIIAVLLVVGGSVAALGFLAIVLVGVLFWVFYSKDSTKTDPPVQAGLPPGFPGGFPPMDGVGPGGPGGPGGGNFNPNPTAQFDADTAPPIGKPSPTAAPATMDAATRDKVKKSTVYLFVTMGAGMQAEGSGFFAFEPGIIVTNAHVVGMLSAGSTEPRNLDVVINSGAPGEKTVKGKVLGVDRVNDLAVVRVPSEGMPPPLPVETAASLSETQDIYVFGYPYGKALGNNGGAAGPRSNPSISIDKASVKSLSKYPTGAIRQIVVTGDMQPGNSGGPVVDAAGRLVGVSVAIIKGTRINFAVPADCAIAMVNGRLAERHYGDRTVDGNQIKLPVKVQLLDPLKHVSSVEFEVWAGKPGEDRLAPANGKTVIKEGDGPRKRATLKVSDSRVDGHIDLPGLKTGQVHWVQPILVNGTTKRYLTARALPNVDFPSNTVPTGVDEQKATPEAEPGAKPPKVESGPANGPTSRVGQQPRRWSMAAFDATARAVLRREPSSMLD
jgi:S1-C subfamily serine protease